MERVLFFLVRLRGIEPPHTVPETIALSTELQAQKLQWNYTTDVKLMQRKAFFFVLCALICYNNIINLISMYYLGHALGIEVAYERKKSILFVGLCDCAYLGAVELQCQPKTAGWYI